MTIKQKDTIQKIALTLIFCLTLITIIWLVATPVISHLAIMLVIISLPIIGGLFLKRIKGYEIIGESLIWTFWTLIILSIVSFIVVINVMPKGC